MAAPQPDTAPFSCIEKTKTDRHTYAHMHTAHRNHYGTTTASAPSALHPSACSDARGSIAGGLHKGPIPRTADNATRLFQVGNTPPHTLAAPPAYDPCPAAPGYAAPPSRRPAQRTSLPASSRSTPAAQPTLSNHHRLQLPRRRVSGLVLGTMKTNPRIPPSTTLAAALACPLSPPCRQ